MAAGKEAAFSVQASGTGLSYIWQYSSNGGKSWKKWGSGTGISVLGLGDRNAYQFRCRVTDKAGMVVTSKAVILKVTFGIGIQPKNASGYVGKTVEYSISAGGNGLNYLWQFSKDGGKTWGTWGRTRTISVPITAARNAYRFRCMVGDNAGHQKTSNVVKLTVIPRITVQPKSVQAAAGKQVSLSVTATGASLKYKWYISKDNGLSWYYWGGTRTTTFKAIAERNGYLFHCEIRDANGKVLTSNTARLTVK